MVVGIKATAQGVSSLSNVAPTPQTRTYEVFHGFRIIQIPGCRDIVVSGLPKYGEEYQFDLINARGNHLKSIRTKMYADARQDVYISGDRLSSGMYLVRITSPRTQEILRLIIQ